MRRALLLSAVLIAAGCSHKSRTPAQAKVSPAESAAAVSAIEGLQPQPGETVVAVDVTGSGKPNLWKYSVLVGEGKERIVRRERDLNGDGRVDVWETFDDDGNVAKQVFDMDFDGKADLVVTYEKGQLVKKEMAPGFDGMARTIDYYENGKLVRKERDQKGSGKVDTWEYFENGQLDRIGTDLDGDGQVDKWDPKRDGTEKSDADAPDLVPPAPAAAPAKAPAKTK